MGGSSSFKDEYTFGAFNSSLFLRSSIKGLKNRGRLSPNTPIESLYLVPRDLSVGHFIHILSSRLRLPPGKALFVFVKNTLPQTASMMDSVYKSFKDEDGFLYMYYSTEKTFG
ncbi:Ubiquitin-like domain superfamily [Sesbania bispinosa]|nr:Ubiquitin-like domain superfamily [Sesbania bispinosa]